MGSIAAQSQATRWLVENGPRELEQLFRAIVIHSATPVLISNTDRLQDNALFLLDVEGCVAAWYSGAERLYGFGGAEALGQNVSFLLCSEETLNFSVPEELKRCAAEGHLEKRSVASEEGRGAILGQRRHNGAQKRKRGVARLCEVGTRLQRAS